MERITCPNCGRKTSSHNCQWCSYPISKRPLLSIRRLRVTVKSDTTDIQTKKQPEINTNDKRKLESLEARKARDMEFKARKQAEVAAKEKAKQEADAARKAREDEIKVRKQYQIDAKEKAKQEAEAEKARKQVEIAAQEKTRRESEEAEKIVIKHLEKYLEEIESTRDDLDGGKISTEEAIQKIRNVSKSLSKPV